MATQKDVNAMILAQLQDIGKRLDLIEANDTDNSVDDLLTDVEDATERFPKPSRKLADYVDGIPTKAKAKRSKASKAKASGPITVTVAKGEDMRGNPGLTLTFSDKPSQAVREAIGRQGLGWGWSPRQGLWYKSTASAPMATLKREAKAIADMCASGK